MAMTKAEQARMQELIDRASLTLPPYEEPKPSVIDRERFGYGKPLFVGWTMNAYNGEVSQGCSNGFNHSRYSTEKTTTQGAGHFYDTKLEAMQAMRWAMTREVMKKLGKLDAEIAKEAAKLSPTGAPNA